jgi:hypothetical protein
MSTVNQAVGMKLLVGICGFFLLVTTALGFMHSWSAGLLRGVLAVAALFLIVRLLKRNVDWLSKILGALGLVFLVSMLSIAVDFIMAALRN